MSWVVYKALNTITNKCYIGISRNFETRKQQHLLDAKRGTGFRFHESIRKYGEDAFEWSIIDTCETQEEAVEKEFKYVKLYNSYINGYNDTKGGPVNPMDCDRVKQKHDEVMGSEEVRRRISNTMSNLIKAKGGVSKATREKQSNNMKGNTHWKGRSVFCEDESGKVVAEFDQVAKAARWWMEQGYDATNYSAVIDTIRRNAKRGSYFKGLKWFYGTPGHIENP